MTVPVASSTLPLSAVAAQNATARAASDLDTPAARRAESTDLLTTWEDCRLALLGSRAMQSQIERFLPRHPKEKPADYQRRARFTAFFNAFARTVRGIAGMPFRLPPTVGDNIPPTVRDHLEDIDGDGTHLDIFARRLFEDALAVGPAGILVDVPPADAGLSKADETALGIRPYWIAVRAEDVISWKSQRIGSRRHLTQLVLREVSEKESGSFLYEPVTRYLVYRRTTDTTDPITVQRYIEQVDPQARGTAKVTVVPEGDPIPVRNVDRIPFVPLLLGLRTSECTSVTPLLDLLDTNLQHFRVSSDRNWLMHLSCVPVPVKKGSVVNPAGKNATGEDADGRTQAWGANVLMRVPADGDFYYREPMGTAFQPTGDELKQLEQRMAALGLAFLASETRAAETAEAKRLDAAVQNATLAACADALDDAIEQALALHAQFLKLAVRGDGKEWSGGEWSTSRDYEQTVLSPQMLATYAKMEVDGQLSLATLWKIMTKLGALPEDFDPEDEQRELDAVPDVTIPSDGALPTVRGGPLDAADDAADDSADDADDDSADAAAAR